MLHVFWLCFCLFVLVLVIFKSPITVEILCLQLCLGTCCLQLDLVVLTVGAVLLTSASSTSTDCKQRSSTVCIKALTVTRKVPSNEMFIKNSPQSVPKVKPQ